MVNTEYIKLAKQSYDLSRKLADQGILHEIKALDNRGKRIDMGVSSTLILDAFDAFGELYKLLEQFNANKTNKVSLSLLIRYIHEVHINFLYVFNVKTGLTKNRAKAFFHYGEYIKVKTRGIEDPSAELKEWMKYVPENCNKSKWHGKTFKDISLEANYGPIIYGTLSQFTHPGIFIMERILFSDLFTGTLDTSILFTSASICNIMEIATNKKLYGLKYKSTNKSDIISLIKLHNNLIEQLDSVKT